MMNIEKDNKPESINLREDSKAVFISAIEKTKNLVTELISNKFRIYKSLKEANITPNNIINIRIVLLVFGTLFFFIGQKELGFSLLAFSVVGDLLDGKVARINNQKSLSGEIYDAGIDKITDISLSTLSTVELILNPILAGINGVIGLIKAWQHYKGQFRKGRPNPKEQGEIIYNCFFKDEKTKFIDKKTNGAANKYGKYKTTLQLVGSIGILGNSTVNEHINMGDTEEIINYLFILLGGLSIIFGYLSNKKS